MSCNYCNGEGTVQTPIYANRAARRRAERAGLPTTKAIPCPKCRPIVAAKPKIWTPEMDLKDRLMNRRGRHALLRTRR